MWKKGKSKILIVDDCISSTLTIKKILIEGGYSVLSSCGEQGIKVAMGENPDIILLEILLQNRNGLELLCRLKDNDRTKHIPVLVVTKSNTQKYITESYSLGAYAYLVKPNHNNWLLQRINSLIK